MPDAIASDCEKCTQKQKEGSEKVIKFLSMNKPMIWEELDAIYDPEGLYKDKYMTSSQNPMAPQKQM